MGDGPGSKKAVGDGIHRDGQPHAEAATLLYFPPKPGQKQTPREVHNGPPVILAQSQDQPKPLTPAEQANREIADHQSKALAAAKAHDTVTADRELKAAITLADGDQTKAKQLLTDFNRTSEKEGNSW